MTTKVVQGISLSCLNMFRQLYNQRAWNERKQCPGERNALNLGPRPLILLFLCETNPRPFHTLIHPLPEPVWTGFSWAQISKITSPPTFLIMYGMWCSPESLWGLIFMSI